MNHESIISKTNNFADSNNNSSQAQSGVQQIGNYVNVQGQGSAGNGNGCPSLDPKCPAQCTSTDDRGCIRCTCKHCIFLKKLEKEKDCLLYKWMTSSNYVSSQVLHHLPLRLLSQRPSQAAMVLIAKRNVLEFGIDISNESLLWSADVSVNLFFIQQGDVPPFLKTVSWPAWTSTPVAVSSARVLLMQVSSRDTILYT